MLKYYHFGEQAKTTQPNIMRPEPGTNKGVTIVTGQNQTVNGGCVVGNTNPI